MEEWAKRIGVSLLLAVLVTFVASAIYTLGMWLSSIISGTVVVVIFVVSFIALVIGDWAYDRSGR